MMRISGFIFGAATFTVTMAQYLIYVWILEQIQECKHTSLGIDFL